MRRTLLVLLAACGPSSDGIPKDDFAYWGADILCERYRECQRGVFESAWYSMGDCQRDVERDLGLLVELMDDLDCDYDAKEAAVAYQDIDEMTCEEFYEGEATEATDDIWGDCFGYTIYTTTTTWWYF